MTVLVVGSVAIDTVETPFGLARDALGGSAVYFSLAARHFSPVRLVGVVGEDFPLRYRRMLAARRIDAGGLVVSQGATFRWHGRYDGDLGAAQTLETRLNVLGGYVPEVPAAWRRTPFVFLANGPPASQAAALDQMGDRPFAVADTMNLWIETEAKALRALLRRVDGLSLNDEEAKSLAGERNLIRAGRRLLQLGPRIVVVKKGEHGAFLFSRGFRFALPAYPSTEVRDPTGAGDAFAGGFVGYLARARRLDPATLKRAMAYGTATASINVESFSVSALRRAQRETVERRVRELARFIAW